MNKQELIDELNNLLKKYPKDGFYSVRHNAYSEVLELVEQLEESRKIFVPKYVAELLDYYRDSTDVDLLALLITFKDWYYLENKDSQHDEAIGWLVKNPEKFMRAWLDGYEVEKEPLYRVKLGEGYFVEYQGRGALIIPDENEEIKIFDSKSDAERTAQTIGGTVEEVAEG
ncbi:DUF1642 domain-containing protein [Enterococcus faecium]|uniref:DUF1642 domain-containing protein n=1 Tax=Enterococcus faecium TaxID=1352 RepID=UPI00190E82A5|nr:DUF1642 domain-containing protein [Enterococcus faecium]MBK4832607.1 hypothetical protein [Enterococcus faecium]